MSLFKTPKSPYYQYSFQMSGRRYHGSTKCTNKQKAEIFERRRKEEIALGCVDKRGSQPGEVLIQACLLEGQAWIAET